MNSYILLIVSVAVISAGCVNEDEPEDNIVVVPWSEPAVLVIEGIETLQIGSCSQEYQVYTHASVQECNRITQGHCDLITSDGAAVAVAECLCAKNESVTQIELTKLCDHSLYCRSVLGQVPNEIPSLQDICSNFDDYFQIPGID